ncbi:MAG: hypothetical protein O2954_15580 [bacterium]|nr:hypothetical protein [bacterium]
MDLLPAFVISLVSGFYTSLWGAFKDSPYEGWKPRTFFRSVYFHIVIFAMLVGLPFFREQFVSLHLFQVFFLIMGLERFLAELYKGFFRTENQDKYFVPSRITFLGKYVGSDFLRYSVGMVLVTGVFCLLFLDLEIRSFTVFLIVAYAAGLLVALGGAYKDAPFEGFKPLKFQRSAVVLAVCSPLFYWINDSSAPVSLGYLIYMNGGLERFLVEYYKTYIQRNMSGKFRPDLPRIPEIIASREKFHYMALVIIAGLIAVYLYELNIL